MPGKRYYARRPFGYCGQDLDRGQVITLAGAINDDKLIRLGFVGELSSRAETHQCGKCGAEFIGIGERTGHGDRRHKFERDLTPEQEDARAEREERMLQEVAPLNLENTAAARR